MYTSSPHPLVLDRINTHYTPSLLQSSCPDSRRESWRLQPISEWQAPASQLLAAANQAPASRVPAIAEQAEERPFPVTPTLALLAVADSTALACIVHPSLFRTHVSSPFASLPFSSWPSTHCTAATPPDSLRGTCWQYEMLRGCARDAAWSDATTLCSG